MALIRCNKCGHVAEMAAEHIGTSVACPACGNETPAYDTVLFVRKVLQQYFALRDELQALAAGQFDTALVSLNDAVHPGHRTAGLFDAHDVRMIGDAVHHLIVDFHPGPGRKIIEHDRQPYFVGHRVEMADQLFGRRQTVIGRRQQ